MASLALAFDVLAKDHASKTLDHVGDKAEKTGRRISGAFGGLGKLLTGALAGVAVGGFLKGAIDEATEAAKVGAQTAAVLKSTGGAAGITSGQISKLATKLSNLAGVDDELVQQGENVLLTFTNVRNAAGKNNDVFDQATGLALDMSKALGTDLQGSIIQVGKALNDPIKGITALSRVGVSFTEQQKKQIETLVKSGKTLDAQKLILSELRKEFGGTAAAVATPAEKLQVAWGNLKEQIGGPVLTVLNAFANFLSTKVIPGISSLGSTIGPVAKRIVDAISGIYAFVVKGDFNAAFGRAFNLSDDSAIVGKLFDFRDKVVSVIGKISDTFATIGGKIQAALDTFVPDVKKFAKNLASGMAATAAPIIDGVKQGLDSGDWKPLGKSVGKALIKALQGTADLAGKLYEAVKKAFSKVDWVGLGIEIGKQLPSLLVGIAAGVLNFDLWGLIKGVGKHWQDVLLAVLAIAFTPGKIIGKIGEMLARVPFVGSLLKWGFEAFAALSKRLVGWVGDTLGKMAGAFVRGLLGRELEVVGGFRRLVDHIITWLYVKADDFLKAGGRLVRAIGEGILKGIESLGSAVRAVLGRLAGWLRSGVSSAASGVVSLARSAFSPIIDAISTPVRSAVSKAGIYLNNIVRAVSGLKSRITTAARGVWDALVSGLKSALNSIIQLWNGIDFKISVKVPGWVPGIGGKGWTSGDIFPDIPLLARGGNILRDGLAVVGDAGPELLRLPRGAQVTPLSHVAPQGTTVTIESVSVVSAPGERAEQSVPRALRTRLWAEGLAG